MIIRVKGRASEGGGGAGGNNNRSNGPESKSAHKIVRFSMGAHGTSQL